MMITRTPLHPHYDIFIPATIALARLDEAAARSDLAALRSHKEPRVRRKTAARMLMTPVRPHAPEPVGSISDERLQLIRECLQDATGEVRELGLRQAARQSDPRLPALLIPHLVDRYVSNRELACEALRVSRPSSEADLQALHPYLAYNPENSDENYAVRLHAAHCLFFQHGSLATQARLLEVFDDEELGIKAELCVAFCHCPDLADLQNQLISRIDRNPNALFALGALNNPELKPHFTRHLSDRRNVYAEGAVTAMLSMLAADDLAGLQDCRDYWRVP